MGANEMSQEALWAVLSLWLTVTVIRSITEHAYPAVANQRWWTRVVLPAIPVTIGIVASLTSPTFCQMTSLEGKLKWGVMVGALAGQGHEIVKGALVELVRRLTGVNIGPLFVAKPPTEEEP